MQDSEFSLAAADGQPLHGHCWQPPAPRACIVLVHGICEHLGRYGFLAGHAVARDLALLGVDLRGHGRSPGERAWVTRFDEYLLDVDAAVAAARARFPGLPLFLMGHSMGGAVALRWLATRGEAGVRGLVLSSAALRLGDNVPRALVALAPLLSRLLPRLRGKRVDPATISRDPEQVAAYVNDPLNSLQAPPARTGAELLRAMQANMVAVASLHCPVYLFHGDADTLTDPGGSRAVYAAWGSSDKTLRLWPGSLHETLNDLDREAVAAELMAWLGRHL